MKITVIAISFFQARKLITKWHLSESLTFQNLLKNRKLLRAENFINILLLTKNLKQSYYLLADSFIENNLNNMTLGLKFVLWLNGKLFDFKKTSFRLCYGFLVAINVFL